MGLYLFAVDTPSVGQFFKVRNHPKDPNGAGKGLLISKNTFGVTSDVVSARGRQVPHRGIDGLYLLGKRYLSVD